MQSSSFDEANYTFSPPDGMSEDNVASIRAMRGEFQGAQVVVTCWKPTRDELDEITRTGRVWVVILGSGMPPICVLGRKPNMKVR